MSPIPHPSVTLHGDLGRHEPASPFGLRPPRHVRALPRFSTTPVRGQGLMGSAVHRSERHRVELLGPMAVRLPGLIAPRPRTPTTASYWRRSGERTEAARRDQRSEADADQHERNQHREAVLSSRGRQCSRRVGRRRGWSPSWLVSRSSLMCRSWSVRRCVVGAVRRGGAVVVGAVVVVVVVVVALLGDGDGEGERVADRPVGVGGRCRHGVGAGGGVGVGDRRVGRPVDGDRRCAVAPVDGVGERAGHVAAGGIDCADLERHGHTDHRRRWTVDRHRGGACWSPSRWFRRSTSTTPR